jgi:hypothetical protein
LPSNLAHEPQRGVAGGVSKGIVAVLEVANVRDDQRRWLLCPLFVSQLQVLDGVAAAETIPTVISQRVKATDPRWTTSSAPA